VDLVLSKPLQIQDVLRAIVTVQRKGGHPGAVA
jgi:hypothetical protein